MKKLTLQIDRKCFDTILRGVQSIEHRFIYPSNVKRYVYFKHRGNEYRDQFLIPEDDEPIDIVPVHYDALYLINGRRKNAPRLTVEVERAEYVEFTDEDGNVLTYQENGQEYVQCQVWYHLGKVLSVENLDVSQAEIDQGNVARPLAKDKETGFLE